MGRVTETTIWYENGKLKGAIGKTFLEEEAKPNKAEENPQVDIDLIPPRTKTQSKMVSLQHTISVITSTTDMELEKEKNDLENKTKKLRTIEKVTPVIITITTIVGAVAGIVLAIWSLLTLHGSTTTITQTLLATLLYIVAGAIFGVIFWAITHEILNRKRQKYVKAVKNLKVMVMRLEKSKKLAEELS